MSLRALSSPQLVLVGAKICYSRWVGSSMNPLSMYGQSRNDAEETYTDKRSTFWGDIRLQLEKATLVHLNTVKLALGTEEKALMREMGDSDDIVLERRLEIIRNKKGINAREICNHVLSDEGSGLTYTQSNGRGVTNGYAFG